MCVNRVRVLDGDEQPVFVKSEFMKEGFNFNVDVHDGARNVFRAWPTEGCVLRVQRVCVCHVCVPGSGRRGPLTEVQIDGWTHVRKRVANE